MAGEVQSGGLALINDKGPLIRRYVILIQRHRAALVQLLFQHLPLCIKNCLDPDALVWHGEGVLGIADPGGTDRRAIPDDLHPGKLIARLWGNGQGDGLIRTRQLA